MRQVVLQCFLAYLVLLSIGSCLLLLSYTLPRELLDNSIHQSLQLLKLEGMYPQYGLSFRKITLDNYTDSLMLNTAYFATGSEPVAAALLNNRGLASVDEIDQITNLESTHNQTNKAHSPYARYWHGYTIFLRPLLVWLEYGQLRLLLTTIIISSFLWLVYQTYQHKGLARAVAVLVAGVATDVVYVGQSMQFSQVFIIGILASLFYLYFLQRQKQAVYVLFFVTGGLTAFFDLLTAPLVTLGLLLLVSVDSRSIKSLVEQLWLWSTGFGLVWLSKWLLVDLVLDQGLVLDAFGHVVNRTVAVPDAGFSHWRTVLLNVQQLIGYYRSNKVVAALVVFVLGVLFVFFKRRFTATLFRRIVLWVFLAVLPYAWYVIAANHSYLHVWYTYRAQFLTVGAVVMVYSECINWKKLRDASKSILKSGKHRR